MRHDWNRHLQPAKLAKYASIGLLSLGACEGRDTVVTPPRQGTPVRTIGNVTIQADGRVIYKAPADFVESSRAVVAGTKTSKGGCSWHERNTLGHGETQTVRVAELDPNTCEYVIAKGKRSVTSPGAASVQTNRDHGQPSGTVMKAPGIRKEVDCNSGTCEVEVIFEQGVSYDSYPVVGQSWQEVVIEDPVYINVVQDRDLISWGYRSDTHCFFGASGYYRRYYFWPTDWRKGAGGGWISRPLSCSEIGGSTYGTYYNPTFCDYYAWMGGTVNV